MKIILTNIIILCSLVFTAAGQISSRVQSIVREQSLASLKLCKHLHQNPELSFEEFETSKLMAEELKIAGFEVTENFSGNTVVGMFKNGEGPVIMLRTDMDALPVRENTGLPFSSNKKAKSSDGKEVPVMHACGHDIHMSVWTGTIHSLIALKDRWSGTLLVIAQQAEEVSGGAGPAIEAGLFSKFPVPDYALAYHINPELESGQIGLVPGPVFAGVKTAEIRVFGEGGHGAYPEKCIDPIVIASRIVLDIQTIVSREISPLEPIVVTVGSIHGGTRPNIIPDEVKMELTLRYYSDEAIDRVVNSLNRISKSAAMAAGMPEDRLPEVNVSEIDTPPVLNDDQLSNQIKLFAEEAIGSQNILATPPAMVGEDFGKYGHTPENIPICLIWLGSTNPELMKELNSKGLKPPPLHSANLMPDYEKTIETGINVMVHNVLGLMNTKN